MGSRTISRIYPFLAVTLFDSWHRNLRLGRLYRILASRFAHVGEVLHGRGEAPYG